MYMRKILSRILMGCYVMAAILFVGACNDDVDIQQSYPFSIETMPVPKKLKVGETAEIRCQLPIHASGRNIPALLYFRINRPTDGRCVFSG